VVDLDPHEIILFNDEAILVVNKPYGLLSLQDGYDKKLPYISTVLEPAFGRIWMVHRLDRDTSGVMVVARTQEAHRSLNRQFQNRQVIKIYHALVVGSVDWQTMRVNQPLRKDGDRQHRTVIDPQRGKPATTDFRLIEQFNGFALIEARPYTGYTHQIRVHLGFLGLAIAADPLYGDGKPVHVSPSPSAVFPKVLLSRLGLHACSLSFSHPISNTEMIFQAPYPPDLAETLAFLKA
jgi:RluA family pseudouridine synthase